MSRMSGKVKLSRRQKGFHNFDMSDKLYEGDDSWFILSFGISVVLML